MNVLEYRELFNQHPSVLDTLLVDRTSKKNIIWATNSYKKHGYKFNDNIQHYVVINGDVIVPRSQKEKEEQVLRSKKNAEVFTPSWICNIQNNAIDKKWFKRSQVFNIEKKEAWEATKEKIFFTNDQNWIDYVKDVRLEISCGEAPYLVSRYDSTTGEGIDCSERIGLLDRKFRVIKENYSSKEEWISISKIAMKSIYGYEWQGDNLFLARQNLLFSYIDYYKEEFSEFPDNSLLCEIAEIISWNMIQMDGIKYVIPNSCKIRKISQFTLFGEEEVISTGCAGCTSGNHRLHNGIYALTMDWEKKKKVRFIDIIGG